MSLPNGLIPTKEAARILGVSPRAVRKWIAAGKLQGWRVGGVWRTTAEAVEAFAKPSVASGKDAANAIASTEQHRRAKAMLAAMGIF